jgi:hypothetical protein
MSDHGWEWNNGVVEKQLLSVVWVVCGSVVFGSIYVNPNLDLEI